MDSWWTYCFIMINLKRFNLSNNWVMTIICIDVTIETCNKHIFLRLWLYGFSPCFQYIYICDNAYSDYHTKSLHHHHYYRKVPPSSEIIVMFKAISIKIHPAFLNIYNFNINDDPVLSIAITFLFIEIVECSDKEFEFPKKLYDNFQLIGFICTLKLQWLSIRMGYNPYIQFHNFSTPSENSTPL